MDSFSALRTIGGLLTVLGVLAGALWAVRRFNLTLPGAHRRSARRLEVVERLGLDPRRSVVLLRCDDREHLVILGPEGPLLIDNRVGPARPQPDRLDDPPRIGAISLRGSFAGLVERALQPLRKPPAGRAGE